MPAPKGHANYNTEGIGRPQEYDENFGDALADDFNIWFKNKDNVWFENFFREHGINRQTLLRLRARSRKLDEVIINAKEWQEGKIFDGALKRRFCSKTAIFALCANHDYKMPVQNTQTKIDASQGMTEILSQLASTKNLVNE